MNISMVGGRLHWWANFVYLLNCTCITFGSRGSLAERHDSYQWHIYIFSECQLCKVVCHLVEEGLRWIPAILSGRRQSGFTDKSSSTMIGSLCFHCRCSWSVLALTAQAVPWQNMEQRLVMSRGLRKVLIREISTAIREAIIFQYEDTIELF